MLIPRKIVNIKEKEKKGYAFREHIIWIGRNGMKKEKKKSNFKSIAINHQFFI